MGKIAFIATDSTPKYLIVNVTVPAGGLSAGDIVLADTVDTTDTRNFSVRTATVPATANLGSRMYMILSGGEFETLADGRRPAGNPNYGTFGYTEGEVAPAVLLVEGLQLWISDGVTSGTPAVGNFLEPVNGTKVPTIKASRTAGTTTGLKVLYKKQQRAGGKFGGQFEIGSYVQVVL